MIYLYLFFVPVNILAIYWLISETDFQVHSRFQWKLFFGAFIPVFSLIFLGAPARWRESIPLGIFAGALIGYRWAYAEPQRIEKLRKMARESNEQQIQNNNSKE